MMRTASRVCTPVPGVTTLTITLPDAPAVAIKFEMYAPGPMDASAPWTVMLKWGRVLPSNAHMADGFAKPGPVG